MMSKELVVTVEVYETDGGNWRIKSKGRTQDWATAVSMGYNRPSLDENQEHRLASYLVICAQEWMEGTREFADSVGPDDAHIQVSALKKEIRRYQAALQGKRRWCARVANWQPWPRPWMSLAGEPCSWWWFRSTPGGFVRRWIGRVWASFWWGLATRKDRGK